MPTKRPTRKLKGAVFREGLAMGEVSATFLVVELVAGWEWDADRDIIASLASGNRTARLS
jgi:hypothetical protein